LTIPTGVTEFRQDVVLNAGRSSKVAFRGPGDTQLNGIVVLSDPPGIRTDHLDRDGTLQVRPRQYVQAVCPSQKLAGRFQLVGNERTPVTLKLESWCSVTGQVLDSDGKPVPNALLWFDSEKSAGKDDEPTGFWYKGTSVRTDKNGRFWIEGLIPGAPYSMLVWAKGKPGQELRFRADWKPGETKDLGKIKTPKMSK
jgi:hypothetical protein